MDTDDVREILHEVERGDAIVLNGLREAVSYGTTNHDLLRREVGLSSHKVLMCTPGYVLFGTPNTDPDADGFNRRKIQELSIVE